MRQNIWVFENEKKSPANELIMKMSPTLFPSGHSDNQLIKTEKKSAHSRDFPVIAGNCSFKGTVSSRLEQTFNRAWNIGVASLK